LLNQDDTPDGLRHANLKTKPLGQIQVMKKPQKQFLGLTGMDPIKPMNAQTLVLKNHGRLGGNAGYLRSKFGKKPVPYLEPLNDPLNP